MKKAFTLIELLVVIAIIAILGAILFPVFAQAREKARQTQCFSNLRQVAFAAQMYLQDYEEQFFPAFSTGPDNLYGVPTFGYYGWPWLVYPYAKQYEVFWCPSEPETNCRQRDYQYFGYVFGRFPAWGMNQRTLSPGLDPYNPAELPYKGVSLGTVQRPAEILMFVESSTLAQRGRGGTGSTCAGYDRLGYFRVDPPDTWTGAPPLEPTSYGHVWPRHHLILANNAVRDGFASVAFVDGHVKPMRLDALRRIEYWR